MGGGISYYAFFKEEGQKAISFDEESNRSLSKSVVKRIGDFSGKRDSILIDEESEQNFNAVTTDETGDEETEGEAKERIQIGAQRLLRGGLAGEAIAMYEEALLKFPNDPRLQGELGLAYLENGERDRAQELFQGILSRNPDDLGARFGLAVIGRLEGQYEQAIEAFREILTRDPENRDAKLNVAEIIAFEHQNGRTPEAIAQAENYYEELLQQHPDNPDLHNGMASVYLASGRLNEAIAEWEQMSKEYPQESILLSNLGEAYLAAGRIQDVVDTSLKALAIDPKNSDAYFFLGQAELARGNQEEGKAAIFKASDLDPQNLPYREKMQKLGY